MGRPLGRIVRHGGGDVGGDRGSDVGSQDHRGGHLEIDPAVRHKNHRQSKGGAGGLHYHGYQCTNKGEYDHGEKAVAGQVLHKSQNLRILVQVRHRVLHCGETYEQERESR